MEVKKRETVKVEALAIRCVLAVRYNEEDIPNDYPFRKGDTWDVTIDIETGQIHGWPGGNAMDLYMKVCDEGCYYLLDKDGKQIGAIEQNYVPSCIPGEYGDYVDFKIDDSGHITNWKCDADAVSEAFFADIDDDD